MACCAPSASIPWICGSDDWMILPVKSGGSVVIARAIGPRAVAHGRRGRPCPDPFEGFPITGGEISSGGNLAVGRPRDGERDEKHQAESTYGMAISFSFSRPGGGTRVAGWLAPVRPLTSSRGHR